MKKYMEGGGGEYIYKILKVRISVDKLCRVLKSSKNIFFQLFLNGPVLVVTVISEIVWSWLRVR